MKFFDFFDLKYRSTNWCENLKLKTDLEQEQEKLKNDNAIRLMKQDFDLEYQKKLLEVDRLHDSKTLQKYQIDSMERIYNKLGIKEVKINKFVGNEQSNLASILPSLGYTMNQLKSAESQWEPMRENDGSDWFT